MRTHLKVLIAVGSMVGSTLGGAAVPALAGSLTGTGQFVGSVNPQIASLFSQNPSGGAGLRTGVALAVQANPSLADDTVHAALGAGPGQKEAAGAGLGDAVGFLAQCGTCGQGESQVRTAISFADPGTRVGYVQTTMPSVAHGPPDPPPYCKHINSRARPFGNCKNE
jgi:hypothetical protein